MSETMFDSNQFLMMINILNVYTKHLKEDALEISVQELERRWKELLSTLNDCFSYAQSQKVDLRDYKAELKEIVDNLYSVEKTIQKRKDNKVSVLDDMARSIVFIASKIDDVLEGIGWRRVARPITEAIFLIPKKIVSMFSGKTDTTQLLPDSIHKYLPPPIRSLPSASLSQASKKDDNIVDAEWIEVDKPAIESYASQVIRKMHERISRQEAGDEL